MNLDNWTYLDSYPPDGKYLCRMDDCDDEPESIEVIEGQAYKNGKRQIIYGFEWRKAD